MSEDIYANPGEWRLGDHVTAVVFPNDIAIIAIDGQLNDHEMERIASTWKELFGGKVMVIHGRISYRRIGAPELTNQIQDELTRRGRNGL